MAKSRALATLPPSLSCLPQPVTTTQSQQRGAAGCSAPRTTCLPCTGPPGCRSTPRPASCVVPWLRRSPLHPRERSHPRSALWKASAVVGAWWMVPRFLHPVLQARCWHPQCAVEVTVPQGREGTSPDNDSGNVRAWTQPGSTCIYRLPSSPRHSRRLFRLRAGLFQEGVRQEELGKVVKIIRHYFACFGENVTI